MIALEGTLVATVLLGAIAITPVLPAWGAAALLVCCLLGITAMAIASRRFGGHRFAAGLRVFADRERRGSLAAIVLLMGTLGILRALVVLLGAGLPHDAASVAILFATMGVFGALPLGPGAGPAAMLAVFGPQDATAAASAGLAVAASSLLAVAIYAAALGILVGRGGILIGFSSASLAEASDEQLLRQGRRSAPGLPLASDEHVDEQGRPAEVARGQALAR